MAAAGDEGLVLQEVGVSDEVMTKIQARAASLTADRKRRGKTIPEGLATADEISQYRQLASHTVRRRRAPPIKLSNGLTGTRQILCVQ